MTPHQQTTNQAGRFWCDDFDLDLYKAVPEAKAIIEPLADVPLFTHGSTKDGRLNHPSVWNNEKGMIAFFGFNESCNKPDGFYTRDEVVPCTFEESIRDAWCHTVTVLVLGRMVWNAMDHRGDFELLMYHLRGWDKKSDTAVTKRKTNVVLSLKQAVWRFQEIINEFSAHPLMGDRLDAWAGRIH